MFERPCTCGSSLEHLMNLFGPSLDGHKTFCPECWEERSFHQCENYSVCLGCGYYVTYDDTGRPLSEWFGGPQYTRSRNEAQDRAYRLLQLKDIRKYEFTAQLAKHPTWQEVVELLRQRKDEEAANKAKAIRGSDDDTHV
ncbi:MAG TPA: hypothetical protein VGN34_20365 [Ktedonobacteraceae bacterium]